MRSISSRLGLGWLKLELKSIVSFLEPVIAFTGQAKQGLVFTYKMNEKKAERASELLKEEQKEGANRLYCTFARLLGRFARW